MTMQWSYPNKAIFISKYDNSNAYRRIAHSATAVAQTISTLGPLAYIYLRLTFGASPNPPTWCNFSEILTDLANKIGQCKRWDPSTLHNPDQAQTPMPVRLEAEIPFAPARSMAVSVPPTIEGRVDGFIDDLINVFLGTPENLERAPHVVPLAMYATSRPHVGEDAEPIKQRAILSILKLIAEGSPAEIQIVLGWTLYTRKLLIALPEDKYHSTAIIMILTKRTCTKGELETLEGQLNHTAHMIPIRPHFLTRRRALKDSKAHKKSRLVIRDAEAEDLLLWNEILLQAQGGVSMNLVVILRPTRLC
jgi:hypothetical protein